MTAHDWTEEQLERIRTQMLVEPDVLWPVVCAYHSLLHGEIKQYEMYLKTANFQATMESIGQAEVELCRLYCLQEIARHFEMEYGDCIIWTGKIRDGYVEAPL